MKEWYDQDETSKINVIKSSKTEEEKLRENSEIVKQIKELNLLIMDNLSSQNKTLNEIDNEMDILQSKINKNTSKIDNLMSKTSICSLILSAVVQVVIIILLFII